MKFKKLGFETQEGLSLINYEDGWSMEYGSGGSYSVDITLNGIIVANVIEEGNGGPVIVKHKVKNVKEVDTAILTFLKRVVDEYGQNSAYDYCKNVMEASDLEYSSLINSLLAERNLVKFSTKRFKEGYQLIMVLSDNTSDHLFASKVDNEQSMIDYMKTQPNLNKLRVKGFRRPTAITTF